MGRWHFEMAQLNMMVRTLIRVAFSTNLPPGTNQDALKCYQQAAKLNPACVAHQVEIGRCLSKMGRRKEAEEALKVRMVINAVVSVRLDEIMPVLLPAACCCMWML